MPHPNAHATKRRILCKHRCTGANTRCTICTPSWRTVQPRCPCDRHVGVIIHHRGDRIRGVAGNAPTLCGDFVIGVRGHGCWGDLHGRSCA
ncbi:MAG: hypothetical protein LBQ76_03480, partial [Candidatus Fibromonas sp.]|nr:hypothetical protein [Candidatus Fibromonas sp.]